MSNRPVTTKERILDAAEELMLEKSFHSVGLNEILAAVEVPKGSFYHYFSSKEQFGVEMLRHYVDGTTAWKRRELGPGEGKVDALRRLENFFGGIIRKTEMREGRCPCLVIKLAAEVADFSEPMRQVLEVGTAEWIGILEDVMREGMATGCIAGSVNPAQMAEVIQDLWTGAIQRSATIRSSAPLRQALDFIIAMLTPRNY